MNEVMYMLVIIMAPFFGIGLYATFKLFLPRILGYTGVINPKKDGSYAFKWVKVGNKKNIKVEGHERIVDPKGRFTGPLGNLFIYIGENSRPVVTDETAQKSIIDVDDVDAISSLTYYAGRLAAARKMDLLEKLFYLLIAVAILNGVLVILYWQDRGIVLKQLAEIIARLKVISP